MGQRVKLKKNRSSVKGYAVKSDKSTSTATNKKKIRVRRKKK